MLVPIEKLGALETICAASIAKTRPWLESCVDAYLSCGKIETQNWSSEKRDKARLQCMVAALYEDDPNKGLRNLLSVQPPMIPLASAVFTPIVNQIKQFRDQVYAL